MGLWLGRLIYALGLSLSMLAALVLFAPWVLARETVSGLFGRWAATEQGWRQRFGIRASRVVDWLHFWEADHCATAFRIEHATRVTLNSQYRKILDTLK